MPSRACARSPSSRPRRRKARAALDRLLLPAEARSEGWPSAYLDAAEAAKLAHGQAVPADPALPCGQVKVYADAGQLIAIGVVTAEHRLTPTRVFIR